ncbi:hypothetical protein [Singulisphaera sp. PoT]|uniref:hypothetical protein n=1 Tax=Singulisphaera sp. PoT TaxID=3411797 RepID=UPI003BF489F4
MRRFVAPACRLALGLALLAFALQAVLLGLRFPSVGAAALAGIAWRMRRRRRRPSDAFGTAAFAGWGTWPAAGYWAIAA